MYITIIKIMIIDIKYITNFDKNKLPSFLNKSFKSCHSQLYGTLQTYTLLLGSADTPFEFLLKNDFKLIMSNRLY